MRFWAYIPPHDTLCPSDVPPKISLQTANMMMREGQYISAQSIKKSPQTQPYQGFASLQSVVPVAGVEPARVISPTDFESASSANSNTPASIILSHLPIPIRENGGTSWRDIKTKLHIQFSKSLAKSRVYTKVV